MKTLFKYHSDPWDTKCLGFRVIKFTIVDKDKFMKNPKTCLSDFFKSIKYDPNCYLLVRVPYKDENVVKPLIKSGFVLLESLMTFSKKISKKENEFKIDNAIGDRKTIEQLAILASKSFSFDRFHIDPVISKYKADMLHYRWVKDSVKNKNKLIFVSRNRLNRPVGFILFKSENGKAIVELVAIEKEYRKRGIGTLLINKVINYARKTNNKTIFVSTQVTNKKAIKLYKKAGFVHDRSVYTLRYYKNEK